MRFKVVARNSGRASRAETLQNILQPIPVNRPGMIEIDPRPARLAEVASVPVKVILREPDRPPAEEGFETSRQPGLSSAASPHDPDNL